MGLSLKGDAIDSTLVWRDITSADFVEVCAIVMVEVLPPVEVTASPPQAVFCDGQGTPLLASGSSSGAELVYEWYSSQAFQAGGPPLSSSPQFTPTAQDTYYLLATDISFTGCNTDTAAVEVLFESVPDLDIPASATLCPGDTMKLELPEELAYDWPDWDGTFQGQPMNPAVFVYFTRLEMVNGRKVVREGEVTLVR